MPSFPAEVSARIAKAASESSTEEDFKIACEQVLVDEFGKIGIDYSPKYEFKIESGRVDALYNFLCLEYKKPGLLERNFDEYVDKKSKYLPDLARRFRADLNKIIGVLLDGETIGFFRYDDVDNLHRDGPYRVNEYSIRKFISYAQTTTRKALIGENVLRSFNHNSVITNRLIQAFWYALTKAQDTRTKMFFSEWHRLFGQVSTNANDAVAKEAASYGLALATDVEFQKFIFCIHSVYALIIKHIAFLILSARNNDGKYLLARELNNGTVNLFDISKRIESGEAFNSLGIKNFLEGDYFCWYTLDWTIEIKDAIQDLIMELDDYEPMTSSLKPEAVRDLMKQLYEGLLSKEMRHSLGEYYTPDWLAEYTIRESGFQPGMKILDPTCGSGTFLVLAINQLVSAVGDAPHLLSEILASVYGFDLNPLAVISARTNYILAIEPFLDQRTDAIELPIYLGDAIFSPSVKDGLYSYFLDTDAGRIQLTLPEELVKTPELLAKTLSKIESIVSYIFKEKSMTLAEGTMEMERFLVENSIPKDHVVELFDTICKLEDKEWDGIWCNIIKNYFSTAQAPSFDIIVGNPPWVRWSALPATYRNTIKDFCKNYDLFSSDRFVGGVESDISTMVVYAAADKWLRPGGTLAMLITRTVFKTESSEGFRKFQIPKTETYFAVSKVEDYTAVRPFENAVNKPSLVVLKKGDIQTEFPVPWIVWEYVGGNFPKTYDSLLTVQQKTRKKELAAHPVGAEGSPWLTVPQNELVGCLSLTRKPTDDYTYKARKGICTDLNGLFYGYMNGVSFVNSFGTVGKTKHLAPVQAKIEGALLYPVARGKQIAPFTWNWDNGYTILPQSGMHGYPVADMVANYPIAFHYFSKHKALLEKRSSLKRYLPKDPFYSIWNVGEYSFAKYKVCWREISSHLQSCVLTETAGKVVIPDHKIYFVPVSNENEAHYLCAVLNATAIGEIVLNYAESTQIGTHIFDYIRIPFFDINNPNHVKLAELSKKAHERVILPEDAIYQINVIIDGCSL